MDGVSVGGRFEEWPATRTGVGGPRGWLPCKVQDLVGQALLYYPLVVIAPYANPSCEVAKA